MPVTHLTGRNYGDRMAIHTGWTSARLPKRKSKRLYPFQKTDRIAGSLSKRLVERAPSQSLGAAHQTYAVYFLSAARLRNTISEP
jgi:hypothetical protein